MNTMIGIDTNILVYANDMESPEHSIAITLIEELGNGSQPWCLAWPSVYEFLRIATHPALYAKPLKGSEAVESITNLLRFPTLSIVGPGVDHWRFAREMLKPINPIGRAAFDIQIAAILVEHGVSKFYSRDRFFSSLGLNVIDPF